MIQALTSLLCAALIGAGVANENRSTPVESWRVIGADGQTIMDLSDVDLDHVDPIGGEFLVGQRPEWRTIARKTPKVTPVRLGAGALTELDDRYVNLQAYPDGMVVADIGPLHQDLLGPDLVPLEVVDQQGKPMRPATYLGEGMLLAVDQQDAGSHRPPLFVLRRDGDTWTRVKWRVQFNGFGEYTEGLCAFQESLPAFSTKRARWGALDRDGQQVLPFEFDEPFFFEGGRARVVRFGEPCWIDRHGVRVSPPAAFREVVGEPGAVVVVDGLGRPVSGPHLDARIAEDLGRILVRSDVGWGMLDLDGGAVLEPAERWLDLRASDDGLILARASTGWGYLELDGTVRIEPTFAEASIFVDGLAAVMRASSHPELEHLPYPQSWFVHNETRTRQQSPRVTSLHRPGERFAAVWFGTLQDGKPHSGARYVTPELGITYAEFALGELLQIRVVFHRDGRTRWLEGVFDENLDGSGDSRDEAGELVFSGEFRAGQPWNGSLHGPRSKGGLVSIRDGVEVERVVVEPPPPVEPSGPSYMTCYICYGAGWLSGGSKWVEEVSYTMIFAGDPNWMRGYDYYKHETGYGRYVDLPPIPCTLCHGSGQVVR